MMFSGGAGSWAAAKRVAAKHGTDNLTLLFTDTLIEDVDLYRFLPEAASNIGVELVTIADGRTPWELFRDERFLGNTRVDICSRVLKRELADKWLRENCDAESTTVYVGIDISEVHRFDRLRERKLPWRYEAPLCEPPYLTKAAMLAALKSEGVAPPRLYALGFAHNNCGGGCVKAGVGHFAHLYKTLPNVYAEWEKNEGELRDMLGNVAILRDRANGVTKPLPLVQLRRRLDDGYQPDLFDIGGCGCFTDLPAPPTEES